MSNAARMMLKLVNVALSEPRSKPLPASVTALPSSPIVQFLTTHGNHPNDSKLIEELRALLE